VDDGRVRAGFGRRGQRWMDGALLRSLSRRWWVPTGRYVAGVMGLAAAYYGAAQLGFTLQFTGPIAAIVWLPVGVGIGGLYLGGLGLWPAVLIGDLLADQAGFADARDAEPPGGFLDGRDGLQERGPEVVDLAADGFGLDPQNLAGRVERHGPYLKASFSGGRRQEAGGVMSGSESV